MKTSTDYQISQTITLSQRLQDKDHIFGEYSGAHLQDALKLAKINALIESGLLPENELVKFIKIYIKHRQKAFFASTCSELSKLGFLLGSGRKTISGKR